MRKVALCVGAVFVLLWTFSPIYWALRLALAPHVEPLTLPYTFYPRLLTLDNFRFVLSDPRVILGLRNSLIIASTTTVLTMLIAIPSAYSLGRYRFRFRHGFLFLILAARSYPEVALIAPFYILYSRLGLIGTHIGMVICHLTITLPFAVWLLMGTFSGLSPSLENAARIDGLNRWELMFKVLLPMSSSAVVANFAIAFLLSWNEFTFAQTFTSGTRAITLSTAVYMGAGIMSLSSAAALISFSPTIILVVLNPSCTCLPKLPTPW